MRYAFPSLSCTFPLPCPSSVSLLGTRWRFYLGSPVWRRACRPLLSHKILNLNAFNSQSSCGLLPCKLQHDLSITTNTLQAHFSIQFHFHPMFPKFCGRQVTNSPRSFKTL